MNCLKYSFLSIALIFCFISSTPVTAAEYTCWINAPDQDDIWVIVYHADTDGNRGNPIWKGKISAGQRKQIKCNDGNIRYDYATEENQPYEGDVSRTCSDNNDIQL